ncbi:YwaF family protein [Pontibacillus marinus]|uniref:ABC transporter permease n=1 Tax=Pontibacillus marinus BH030004 = DSM 16465 TaxID=1385511 RepID=A0A0A5G0V6_9BACI|nr:TIGR02206 family membrane protein [Pontibacillus marinus]KGX84748.1 hypothetical protein N783_16050 [Pontibacillus marinus BH030004 = DSM 16465]
MERWFGKTTYQPFEAFSTSHITVLIFFGIGFLYLILNYKRLQRQSTLYQITRWGLFSILIISEITYQAWTITNSVWSFSEHVPLHLCGIASIIAMLALWNRNKKLIKINFFIGIIPAFLALITPELVNDYPHYRFWKFFMHHMSITWTSLFLVITSSVVIQFRSALKTFGILNLYAVIVFFINRQIGSNYLYLSHTPTASTPLDLLGDGVWYYIHLEILAFCVFLFLWIIYKGVTYVSKNGNPHNTERSLDS